MQLSETTLILIGIFYWDGIFVQFRSQTFYFESGKIEKITSRNLYFFITIFCKANKVLRY